MVSNSLWAFEGDYSIPAHGSSLSDVREHTSRPPGNSIVVEEMNQLITWNAKRLSVGLGTEEGHFTQPGRSYLRPPDLFSLLSSSSSPRNQLWTLLVHPYHGNDKSKNQYPVSPYTEPGTILNILHVLSCIVTADLKSWYQHGQYLCGYY